MKTNPIEEEARVFADTFQVAPTVAKDTPPAAPPPAPAPREKEALPEPVKVVPPEVSVGLSNEERQRLRREADVEIAEADSLIAMVRGQELAPEEEEILLTAEELLRSSRTAYALGDFSGAVGLAKKARLLTAGLAGTNKK